MARYIVYGVRVMANTPVCKGFCTAWLLRKIVHSCSWLWRWRKTGNSERPLKLSRRWVCVLSWCWLHCRRHYSLASAHTPWAVRTQHQRMLAEVPHTGLSFELQCSGWIHTFACHFVLLYVCELAFGASPASMIIKSNIGQLWKTFLSVSDSQLVKL